MMPLIAVCFCHYILEFLILFNLDARSSKFFKNCWSFTLRTFKTFATQETGWWFFVSAIFWSISTSIRQLKFDLLKLGAIQWLRGQDEGGKGSKNVCFCPRSGYKIVHAGGRVKKWQNSVHVVVECPPISNLKIPFEPSENDFLFKNKNMGE